jgi:hypothetical protein
MLRIARGEEPDASASIVPPGEESNMARHLTRARLARGVTGAISALVLCAIAAFGAAHHFAV